MEQVKLELNEKKHGAFILTAGGEKIGEMVIGIAGDKLTVYHTEVAAQAEGQGYAQKMLDEMVAYARENKLKVVPLCAYVHARFRRHPDAYKDLWPGAESE